MNEAVANATAFREFQQAVHKVSVELPAIKNNMLRKKQASAFAEVRKGNNFGVAVNKALVEFCGGRRDKLETSPCKKQKLDGESDPADQQ